MKNIASNLGLILTTLLLLVTLDVSSAEVGPADLQGEDKAHYDKFRDLFMHSSNQQEFFDYVALYGRELKTKKYMMLYYKLRSNEGFYALRHGMVYRALRVAEELDLELRQDGASDYFYLATGLMGDVYYSCHDRRRAEQYFQQALGEVGDRDPKFTMRCYHFLAETVVLKNPQKADEYLDLSIELANQTNNAEYLSLSLALKAYMNFLSGNSIGFNRYYNEYLDEKSKNHPGFNPRYDRLLEVARRAFSGDFKGAHEELSKGNVAVDSSLVAVRIYAMDRDIESGFEAISRSLLEMDSVHSVMQSANFDQLASERTLMRSREEAEANKKMVKKLTNWLIGLTIVYIFIYVMGRRRLVRKIWARNKELKDALSHAEESDRMKSAFISNMSHEIRTPLNAVAGFAELLCNTEMELGEAEKKDMKMRISDNVELITSIVNELLEVSKSESEVRSEAEMSDMFCNVLCREVLRTNVSKVNKGVETRFSTNVTDDFTIRTHPATVKRILTHVLDNAAKFTEEGHIDLKCAFDKEQKLLKLSVTDTGCGIPEEDRDRIFELFEKSDEFKAGVGLGLPICRRLSKSIGAEIVLDSSYVEGSRFVLTIPYL